MIKIILENWRDMSKNKKEKVELLVFGIYVVVTLLAYIYRISLHADVYDEIINLDVSYRIALGDIPFYNCWEAFQGGDIFLAIILFLYIKLFKTTVGIVLFSRCVYFICWMCLSFFVMKTLQLLRTTKQSFLSAYPIVFFELYSLFYFWYDSVSVFFFLLGATLLYRGYITSKKRYFIFAGLSHCMMVVSYPSFIIIALSYPLIIIIYSIIKKSLKSQIPLVLYYALGAIFLILSIIIFYVIRVGVNNILDTLNIILGSRGINKSNNGLMLIDVCKAYIRMNPYLCYITVILIVEMFLMRKNRIQLFALSLVIFPFFNIIFNDYKNVWGLADYISYLALWCPILYLLKRKRDKTDILLIGLFWIPAMISNIAIAISSAYSEMGPIKAWQACLPGFLASLVYIMDILKENKTKEWISNCTMMVVPIILIFNSFYYVYLHQDYIKVSDERINVGIFYGIKVNSEMREIGHLQSIVWEYTKGYKTVLAGGQLRSIYLMTDLRPFVWSVETPNYMDDGELVWDRQFEYMKYFNDIPDVLFIEPKDIENEKAKLFVESNYDLVYSEGNINHRTVLIYHRK